MTNQTSLFFIFQQGKSLKSNKAAEKTRVKIRQYFPILYFLALTGCADLNLLVDLTCASGLCNSKDDSLAKIKWQPAELNNASCPSLNGKYQAKTTDYLFDAALYVGFKNWPIDKKTRLNNIQVISDFNINTIPLVRRSNGAEDMNDFYKNAVIDLFIGQNSLTVTLIGGDGLDYRKTVINFDGTMVGCYDGIFTIRTSNARQGIDGSLGYAYSKEALFTKLPDGNLQVTINRREWRYGWARGLVGDLNTGDPDRKKTETFFFPSKSGL